MIGIFVKEKRNKLCLTQKELAKEIGVTQSYINLIELDKRKIGKKKIKDFAKVLNVSKEELEKNNNIEVNKYKNNETQQARKKINRQKLEMDILIQKMRESLDYLEKARETLDTICEDDNK